MIKFLGRLKNVKLVIRDKEIRLPSPPGMKIRTPGIMLKMPSLQGVGVPGNLRNLVFGTVILSGLFVAGAVYFSIAGVTQAHEWPEPGAAYSLGTPGGTVGEPLPDENIGTSEQRESQTLQINLASGVRLSTLTLKNMDLGKTGLTTCLSIGRAANTTGWMYVDAMALTGVSMPTFDMANAEIATLTLAAVVDGRTNSATLDSTIAAQVIVSTRGAGSFTSEDAVVDRVVIELAGDASIGALTIENVKCSVGNFDLDYIKAGSFTMDATSRIGAGNGIDTADMVVNSTVKPRVSPDTMVETPLKIQ